MNKIYTALSISVLFFIFNAATATPASAATTFNVNATVDAVDAVPGDGICETALGNGECTLRAAVQEANTLTGASVISIPAGEYILTIPGQSEDLAATGDLDLRRDISLIGAGADTTIISGNGLDRVIQTRYFPAVGWLARNISIKGVTIRGGRIISAGRGGGIYSHGNTVVIRESNINSNSVHGNISTTGYGGGIYYGGSTIEIYDSVIQGNNAHGVLNPSATGSGGGIAGIGTLKIHDSTLRHNRAYRTGGASGGGIYVWAGSLELVNSSVENSFATGGAGGAGSAIGAGIYFSANDGTGFIESSSISNNQGGGIRGGSLKTLTIKNSTISDNDFIGLDSSSVTTLTLESNSIARNGNRGVRAHGITNLHNNIFFNSVNCELTPSRVTSLGYNLVTDNSSCGLTGTGDIEPGVAQFNTTFAELANNGGPTLTRALLEGNPAIDAGDPINCLPTDQRGVTRPQGVRCDIGAYEAEPFNEPPVADAGPDQTADEGALVAFDGTGTTDPDGIADIVSYEWTFGDGDIGSGIAPTHTYDDNGVYLVTLTVEDTAGETSQDTMTVTVENVSPTASFEVSPSTIIQGESATLTFSDPVDPGTADTLVGFLYSYDCTNDGTFEVVDTAAPSHVCDYPISGTYDAHGRINDKDGGFTDYVATITVQTPAEAIGTLITTVESYNLPAGIENSLIVKLETAQQILTDGNPNNDHTAINSLQSFINAVEAQRGGALTNEQADELIAAAQAIINNLT